MTCEHKTTYCSRCGGPDCGTCDSLAAERDQLKAALKLCIKECGCAWSAQGGYNECSPTICAICAAKALIERSL